MKSDREPSSECGKRIQEHIRKMLKELADHHRLKVVAERYEVAQASHRG